MVPVCKGTGISLKVTFINMADVLNCSSSTIMQIMLVLPQQTLGRIWCGTRKDRYEDCVRTVEGGGSAITPCLYTAFDNYYLPPDGNFVPAPTAGTCPMGCQPVCASQQDSALCCTNQSTSVDWCCHPHGYIMFLRVRTNPQFDSFVCFS